MNGRALDHIVLVVNDLDAGAATYEALGFALTPRAYHEDRMGTSNRLAQFQNESFIEILEVDRPDRLARHDFAETPAFFSFGDHNRTVIAGREGISMLVFQTDDARADVAAWDHKGIDTYAPFDFERTAKLPDGSAATVSFSLGFATSNAMPDTAFFVCQNRAQDLFWKPAFQTHSNGARGFAAVYLATDNIDRDADFLARMFDGTISPIEGGLSVSCGETQAVRVMRLENMSQTLGLDLNASGDLPRFCGISLYTDMERPAIPAEDAHGVFIVWEMVEKTF